MKVELNIDLARRDPAYLDAAVIKAIAAATDDSTFPPHHADELLQPIRHWLNNQYRARHGTELNPIRVKVALHVSVE
jgi:hypothetical protein